ncbi:MAG TPA: hypothetical protein VF238_06550 [Methylomirabilota bacterium]
MKKPWSTFGWMWMDTGFPAFLIAASTPRAVSGVTKPSFSAKSPSTGPASLA